MDDAQSFTGDEQRALAQCYEKPDVGCAGRYSVNYRLESEAIARFRFQRDLDFILRNLPDKRSAILDIGCGSGTILESLASVFQYCEGIERSEFSYMLAKKHLEGLRNVRLRQEDIVASEIRGAFDLVHIGELLMYINDDAIIELLRKVTGVLRENGRVIIRESVSLMSSSFRSQHGGHVALRRTIQHYKKLFDTAGLQIVCTKRNVDYSYSWMVDVLLKHSAQQLRNNTRAVEIILNNKFIRIVLNLVLCTLRPLGKNLVSHYYFTLTRPNQEKKIFGVQNAVIDGLSGGNIRFIEIAKRMNCVEKIIVTSSHGKQLDEKMGLNARFIITDKTTPKSIVLAYIKRTIYALFLNLDIKSGDVLYTTSDFIPDVLPAFLWKRRNRNIKWIQIIHHVYASPLKRRGSPLGNLLGYLSQKISFSLINWSTDQLLLYDTSEGASIKKDFVSRGYSPQHIKLVKNGVDLKLIQNSIRDIPKKNDACFVGRLAESKGVLDLVEIWGSVCKKRRNASLIVIGSGSKKMTSKLKKRIDKLNLGKNVTLTGFLNSEELYKKIKSCRIMVHPSFEEGWGIVLYEAMACGVPIIAWNLPAYSAFFGGMIKVPKGDKIMFTKQIVRLLTDRKLHDELSKKTQLVAMKYSWDGIAREEFRIIESLSNHSH